MGTRSLSIAFFGSDLFSINCLSKLLPHYGPISPKLSPQPKKFISQLDIITRAPKRSGRKMVNLKDVPLANYAMQNHLWLGRADTDDEIMSLLQRDYDICIAVSYGKLIPASFLEKLKFGGLNVHPSLLPKYSGPAPLHRSLLNHDKVTGVTVQSLHPTEFDRGEILLQETYDIPENETIDSLTEVLSHRGGSLLETVLANEMYDPESPSYQVLNPDIEFSYARKVKSRELQINWENTTGFAIVRKSNTLGDLHTFLPFIPKKSKSDINHQLYKRVLLLDPEEVTGSVDDEFDEDAVVGSFKLFSQNPQKMAIKTMDGCITVNRVKLEGFSDQSAAKFLLSLNKKLGCTPTSFHFIQPLKRKL